MRLSSTEEYGLRCLLQLGRKGPGASVTIPELSRTEGISQAHVAKMMRLLRRGGFVASTRGQSGGYALARPAEQIAIGDVLAVLGGRLFDSDFCGSHPGVSGLCAHMGDCSIRTVWRTLQRAVDAVLGALTLKDLLRREPEMNAWASARDKSLPTYSPHV